MPKSTQTGAAALWSATSGTGTWSRAPAPDGARLYTMCGPSTALKPSSRLAYGADGSVRQAPLPPPAPPGDRLARGARHPCPRRLAHDREANADRRAVLRAIDPRAGRDAGRARDDPRMRRTFAASPIRSSSACCRSGCRVASSEGRRANRQRCAASGLASIPGSSGTLQPWCSTARCLDTRPPVGDDAALEQGLDEIHLFP